MLKNKEKLLHNIAARYIVGEDLDIELSGSPAEIDCLFELLEVSKLLKNTLDKKSSTLKEIHEILENKKNVTKRFINLTGINWSL
tara:strand:+ start:765 stop:1019 length:255 start_codon:yes stop_codon:yes gene_type:complete